MMRFYICISILLVSLLTRTRASAGADVGDGKTTDEQNLLDDIIEQVPVKELVDLICECRAKDICETKYRPRDCYDIQQDGSNQSRLYDIYPTYVEGPVQVYCDMDTAGGGWTVFQRREDGLVDFYRGWDDYKHGFGYAGGEFWLGNENIFALSNQEQYELRIDLEDFDDESRFAHYHHFRIGDESIYYKLAVEGYSGTAGDSFRGHGAAFTTKDKDNSKEEKGCAVTYSGAWWYKKCHHSNLNGKYLGGPTDEDATSVNWYTWKGFKYSLKRTEMKMRPITT